MRRRTVILGGLAGLAGCARLPDSGPIQTQPRRSQAVGAGEVAIAPNPPAAGASPELIVQGFLLALATYQPGYQAARLYLTDAARANWQPDRGMLVYADGNAPGVSGYQVTLDAPLVAALDQRGAYQTMLGSAPLHHDFELTKERGEWRIGNPPQGLLMSRYLFITSHIPAEVYFLNPSLTTLVPDVRYFPRGNRVADSAIRALLGGPSDWLRPAVASAIPAGARLSEDVLGQGTVNIALTMASSNLDTAARSMVAAQLAATIRIVPEVTGFRASVNGQPFEVPEAAADGTVPVSAANRFDPVARLTTQLFGISAGRLVRVDAQPGAVAHQVAGDFGSRAREISAFGVSNDGVEAAVVSGDSVIRGPVEGQGSRTVLTAKGLLRPQIDASGAVWAMTTTGAVYRVVGEVADIVPAPAFSGRQVVAFRLSPDGQRIAVVVVDNGRRALGLVRVEKERLAGWRAIPLSRDGTSVGDVLDVGWVSPSSLVVLATASGSEQGVFELDVDAVAIRETGRADRWSATTLAASARSGSGSSARTVVLSGDGVAWQYVDVFRWAKLAEQMTSAAYPG